MATTPSAPSSPLSPRSPLRKKRHGALSTCNTSNHEPCPTIATHYPIFSHATQRPQPPVNIAALSAFQSTAVQKHAMTGIIPLILDTGASVSVTSSLGDFLTSPTPVKRTTLQGIAAGLEVKGIGTATYTVLNDAGHPVTFQIPGMLYVPGCPSRLLCPRQLLATDNTGTASCNITTSGVTLTLHQHQITAKYRAPHNLPVLDTAPMLPCFQAHYHQSQMTAKDNPSSTPASAVSPQLTLAQRLKLQWHQRLNHVNFDQLNAWMRSGHLKVPPEVISAPPPVCPACAYGKAKRRPHMTCTSPIDGPHTKPGDGVSADQLEAGCPGIIPTSKGSPISTRYHYCNVWVDHHSRYIFLTMHQRKDAKEMLQSKLAFEAFSKKHGVQVRHIRVDNGVYSSQLFRASCDSNAQQLTFCGVGSHWQNGIAERCIGTLQAVAQTILLHAMSRWPAVISEAFWPFALQHAANLYNHTARDGATASPWELFTGEASTRALHDYHVFGSPVYVLHKALQDHPGSAPKWQSRCWQGVYLGHSSQHAGNVALVFNSTTQHVTPQFHLSFDDSFSSVVGTAEHRDLTIETILQHTAWLHQDTFAAPGEHNHFPTPEPTPNQTHAPTAMLSGTYQSAPSPRPQSNPKYRTIPTSAAFTAWKEEQGIAADVFMAVPHSTALAVTSQGVSPGAALPCQAPSTHPEGVAGNLQAASSDLSSPCPLQTTHPEGDDTVSSPSVPPDVTPHLPFVFNATPAPSAGDTLTQSAMLKAPDRPAFVKAQISEITTLHEAGVFSYHPIHTLPPKARLLNAIWSYRRKRTPSGVFRKHKARICTDGSQQCYGIDYYNTYAPVVSWSSVRLLLTLSHFHKWHSTHVHPSGLAYRRRLSATTYRSKTQRYISLH